MVILDLQRSCKDNREFLHMLYPASFNTDILHDHDILAKTKKSLLVWGGLTNSREKKRSEKQRRKGRYKHLNAEFQTIARRDKKAFLNSEHFS